METLKINSFEIDVSDFLVTESSIILDLSFASNSAFHDFYTFYSQNKTTIIEYSCGDVQNSGYLGTFVYDANLNGRLYIMFDEPNDGIQPAVLRYNIMPIINSLQNQISALSSLLCKKGVISENEVQEALKFPSVKMDLDHEVNNLKQYLIYEHFDMASLKQMDL